MQAPAQCHSPAPSRRNYLAVIGDVVQSRRISQRSQLQVRLETTLSDLNHQSPRPASAFVVTLGDEFEGLLYEASGLFEHLLMILVALHPVRTRFAVGIGPISTPLNRKSAARVDGPAFHRAREAITELKNKSSLFQLRASRPDQFKFENQALELISDQLQRWNRNRLSIMQLHLQGVTPQEIAARLGLSPKTVYKSIQAGNLQTVGGMLRSIESRIQDSLSHS